MSETKQKMTLHRGLVELKLINSRIEKQIAEIDPVGWYQKEKPINGLVPEKDFIASAQSKYDSIVDLIARKLAIKSALVDANSKTKVTVSGREMTIAEAINYKTIVAHKRLFIATLKLQYNAVAAGLNTRNDKVNERLEQILVAALGKEHVKANKEDVDAVSKPFLDSNTFMLCDPLKVSEKIEAMEKEVSSFEAEVDAVLSEINSITFIEI